MEPPAWVAEPQEQAARQLRDAPTVEDRTPPEGGFHVLSTVARGPAPRPGVQPVRFVWSDVLEAPPPEAALGSRPYAVYHGTEVDEDLRIVHHTLVWLENGQDLVHAEARTHVQRRALLETMERVRSSADARRQRWERRTQRRLARRRVALARWPRPLALPADALLYAMARMSQAVNRSVHGGTRALVQVPDALVSGALRAEAHLLHPGGRRTLWQSLRDPDQLTAEEKGVVVFLSLVLLALGVLVLNSVMALVFPEHAPAYRALLTNAVVQFVSVFGVPIVMEPLLVLATLSQGPVLAFTGFFVGKMLGVWVLYFLGDSAHDAFLRRASPRSQRWMAWLQRNADKYGFPILFLDNALPLMPDQVLWVFAVSGMRFRTWMLAVALGTVVKFTAFIGGVYLLGPERIEQLFTDPFGWFG